jgi:hypothetical protein
MRVTGACHCGAVTFSADVDESMVMVCHCTDCQIIASSAFRFGALVRRETFRSSGAVKEYAKIGTSGARRLQVFCPECGTGIYSYAPDVDSPFISLRLGGVHERARLTPTLQIWRQSALPWVGRLDEIPCSMQQEVIAAAITLRPVQ